MRWRGRVWSMNCPPEELTGRTRECGRIQVNSELYEGIDSGDRPNPAPQARCQYPPSLSVEALDRAALAEPVLKSFRAIPQTGAERYSDKPLNAGKPFVSLDYRVLEFPGIRMFARRLQIVRQLKRSALEQSPPDELRAEVRHRGIFRQAFFHGPLRQYWINFHCTLPDR